MTEPTGSQQQGDLTATVARRRALATLAAIQNARLFSRRRQLYGKRRWLFWRRYEDLWPFANAWSALETTASLPGSGSAEQIPADLRRGLVAYSREGSSSIDRAGPVGFESSVVPPLGRGGDVFYDDNAWLGLALMAIHFRTGETWARELAARVLSFILTGWSRHGDWARPGGIRWKAPASNVSRNTCSNAPVVELAVLLHLANGDQMSLDWALRIYGWVRDALVRTDGLYDDRIAPDGTRNTDLWSYNQGTMIGAGVLLSRVTGDTTYLDQASATAAAAQEHFTLNVLMSQLAAFNAVYFRNLMLLDVDGPDPSRRASLEAYGDAMWAEVRRADTGLFSRGKSPLNDSAPMVQIYALIANAVPRP